MLHSQAPQHQPSPLTTSTPPRISPVPSSVTFNGQPQSTFVPTSSHKPNQIINRVTPLPHSNAAPIQINESFMDSKKKRYKIFNESEHNDPKKNLSSSRRKKKGLSLSNSPSKTPPKNIIELKEVQQ